MISALARRLSSGAVLVVVVAGTLAALAALVVMVDGGELRFGVGSAVRDPVGLVAIGLALLAAFSLRARAWCQLVTGLTFSHSLAGVHLALGANHVLPLRLGEPFRVASVVRRAGVAPRQAVSTTVLLRSADVVALVLLGLFAGAGLAQAQVGGWGVLVLVLVVAIGVGVVASMAGQHSRGGQQTNSFRLLRLSTMLLVITAWLAEAFVVWRVARWFDIELSPQQAVGVLAVAVLVQVVAITPGGFGTYEAAATAAMVAAGAPVATALSAAVVLHAVKSLYSIVAGVISLVSPQPSMLGRLRLDRPKVTQLLETPCDGPVVLFLPARNEQSRVGAVLAAAPQQIRGHKVVLVVVDDGSTDETVTEARLAGAEVISHKTSLGLGAAVRTGLAHATGLGAVAVAFCDADGEYRSEELASLVSPVLDGQAHYVVGSRFRGDIQRMLVHRRFGNMMLTRWVRFVSRTPISDGQSGYRAFSATAAASAAIAHDYNYAQVLTIDMVSKGFGYTEVPITYSFRTTGRSFIRLGTYLSNVVPTVWRQMNPTLSATSPPTYRNENHAPVCPNEEITVSDLRCRPGGRFVRLRE